MMPIPEVLNVIERYASAYRALQELQDNNPDLLAVGDQKTGVIGEFYALLYLKHRYPSAAITYSENPSQTGWDIKVVPHDYTEPLTIQVKTVSDYSSNRTITPISPGWNELYCLFLDRDLRPTGFWVIDDDSFLAGETRTGLRMRHPNNLASGSADIPFGDNRVGELNAIVNQFRNGMNQ